MSKVIQNCIGLVLPSSVIGSENSSHPHNQSYANPNKVQLVFTRFSALKAVYRHSLLDARCDYYAKKLRCAPRLEYGDKFRKS